MLSFAVKYRPAIDQLTGEKAMKLRDYELSEDEWLIALQLANSLKIFKDATLYFSRESSPSIPSVIPAIDIVDSFLATCTTDPALSPALKLAFSLGKDLLNKYYSLSDMSNIYRIAMVLHPGRKLTYFKKAGWPDDWIQTARTIVEDEFKQAYAHYRPTVSHPENSADSDEEPPVQVRSYPSRSCFIQLITTILLERQYF
ncbi:hypothetical protein DFP72DRAFT_811323 [Ephemerocybe angulata]|uniref:Uncharacterized protein n=1 Tax=Ephemerocybe angulata TaxID=980116 RepID=A0A8H6M4N5_9AGAR|nr:hypothetical protein DFP72DRAFT_811323 [Tulosesus angulatus]